HAERLPLRRPAAWRHGGRHRPHRHAARRRAEPARGDPLSHEPAGRGPPARRAVPGHAEATARAAHSVEPAGVM
ncbi:MAG: Aspartyl-tRNA synthetase @ Aspartyl-tRNA(Asn) synthetase, partial [uncultured Microvirga sp.]